MSNKTSQDRHLAAQLLRQLADAIEGDTSTFASFKPMLHALLYEDGGTLQRPTPTPPKPKPPDTPTIFYDEHGARPLGFVRRRVELRDPQTGQRVSWPHNWQQLAKFARLLEPKRIYWSGKSKIYGDALKHFAAYGFIVRRHGNGWQWCRDFTPLQRSAFAQQWRPADTRTPAQPTHSPKGKS